MMNEKDRTSLINYRLEQAKETIELTKFLIDAGKLNVAVNRIYYGLYYVLTALAIKNKYETSKHAQLIGWFNKHFVSEKPENKNLGRILRNAYRNRTKGDYDAFVSFSLEEVEEMQQEMRVFIDQVEDFIKKD
jgi:uncharacterized protein (UPF0332 family)